MDEKDHRRGRQQDEHGEENHKQKYIWLSGPCNKRWSISNANDQGGQEGGNNCCCCWQERSSKRQESKKHHRSRHHRLRDPAKTRAARPLRDAPPQGWWASRLARECISPRVHFKAKQKRARESQPLAQCSSRYRAFFSGSNSFNSAVASNSRGSFLLWGDNMLCLQYEVTPAFFSYFWPGTSGCDKCLSKCLNNRRVRTRRMVHSSPNEKNTALLLWHTVKKIKSRNAPKNSRNPSACSSGIFSFPVVWRNIKKTKKF